MEESFKTPAIRLTSARQVRRFTGRLLAQLRRGELTVESATVQIKIAEVMLAAIKDARAEFEEVEVD